MIKLKGKKKNLVSYTQDFHRTSQIPPEDGLFISHMHRNTQSVIIYKCPGESNSLQNYSRHFLTVYWS